MNLAVLLAATLSANAGAESTDTDRTIAPTVTRMIAFEGRPIALEAPADDKAPDARELIVVEYPEQPPLAATLGKDGTVQLRHVEPGRLGDRPEAAAKDAEDQR